MCVYVCVCVLRTQVRQPAQLVGWTLKSGDDGRGTRLVGELNVLPFDNTCTRPAFPYAWRWSPYTCFGGQPQVMKRLSGCSKPMPWQTRFPRHAPARKVPVPNGGADADADADADAGADTDADADVGVTAGGGDTASTPVCAVERGGDSVGVGGGVGTVADGDSGSGAPATAAGDVSAHQRRREARRRFRTATSCTHHPPWVLAMYVSSSVLRVCVAPACTRIMSCCPVQSSCVLLLVTVCCVYVCMCVCMCVRAQARAQVQRPRTAYPSGEEPSADGTVDFLVPRCPGERLG